MKRVSNLLAWGALAIVAALCFLNWQTLAAVAPLDLVVWQGDAPLGIVLLAMAGVLLVFFLFAYLNNQISSLLENRKLLKEIQRVQALADKAEASRMENLHQLISTEFRLLSALMERPGRVWTREALLDRVWGRDIYVDTRTVDVHIGRLRKAINTGRARDAIRTVRGAGYALESG